MVVKSCSNCKHFRPIKDSEQCKICLKDFYITMWEERVIACQTCNDPTKYIIGLWDGVNGTHGAIYDCHNLDCEINKNRLKEVDRLEENRTAVVEENSRNNIQMLLIKMKRKELRITIARMAYELDIRPSAYSNYEQCQEALPIELGDRIEGVFKEFKGGYVGEILKKYGRGK